MILNISTSAFAVGCPRGTVDRDPPNAKSVGERFGVGPSEKGALFPVSR